jgi:GTP:adenosylcobinamide-phosphate guanylyltransferase
MDAVVMAAGVPREGEPLYPLTRGLSKALLPVAGKSMLQWVLEALAAARSIGRVVVVGPRTDLPFPRELHYLEGGGDYLANLRAGARRLLELDPGVERLLVVSADIPALTSEHVDWIVSQAQAGDHDLCYCVIDRRAMEAAFPGCRRTFYRFRDREVCGGDLAVVRTSIFAGDSRIWQKLTEARKSRWRTAAAIGPVVLLRFLLGRLSIDEVVRVASRRLGIRGRALDCPFPEAGMDVDKPFQRDLVEEALLRRGKR